MGIIKFTKKEWFAEGERLFGKNKDGWKFICPSCGNIQTIKDFKKHKNDGATPSDAYFNCIGRFMEEYGEIGGSTKPCNYTTGGLICLSPVEIQDGDKTHRAFDFYREHKKDKKHGN